MEDQKKVEYVTMEDLMNHLSVIWSFIMLTSMAIIWDDGGGFQLLLASVSSLMFVVTLVYARLLNRRKRRAMG